MKKIIIALMIVLLSACGSAQGDGQNNTDNTDNNEQSENQGIVVLEEPETVYLLTEITSYYPDGSKDEYRHATYEYDDNGCLSRLTRRDDGYYGSGQTLTFDTNGNKTSETSPQITYVIIYEYDLENRLVKEVHEDNVKEYLCDDNGNIVGNSVEVLFTYKYDDKGRVVSKVYDTWFKSPEEKWIYDDNDNLIKHEWTPYGTTDEYTYDKEGKLILETHNNDGEMEYSKSYEYDDLNNLVKMLVYAPSGELTGYAEYTYITADIVKSKQTYTNETIIKEFGIMPPYPYDGP